MTRPVKLILVLVISAVMLAAVVCFVGVRETFRAIAEAGFSAFLSVGALLAILLVLQAFAWGILERAIGHRIPFLTLLEATAIGHAGNTLMPSSYLGGEPARVIYVGRKTGLPYQEIAGTVLLAKYLELLSFVLFLGIGTIVAAVAFRQVLFAPGNTYLGVMIVVIAAAAFGLSALFSISLSRQWKPLTGIVGALGRMPMWRGFWVRLRRRTEEVEHQVSRLFREEGKAVWPAFWFFIGAHVSIFIKPLGFFYLGWRIGLELPELAVFFLTCQVLMAVQVTPSSAGTLDGALLGMIAITGIAIAPPQIAAFLLCMRLWDAALIGIAAILTARVGLGLLPNRNGGPTSPADPGGEASESHGSGDTAAQTQPPGAQTTK